MISHAADLYLSLGDLVAPLRERLATVEELEHLFHRYGWQISLDDTVFATIAEALEVGTVLEQFLRAAEPLQQRLIEQPDSSLSPQDLLSLANSGAALINALASLTLSHLADLPPPLNGQDVWKSVAEHLFDDLLEEYLRIYQPHLYAVLHAGAVIRYEATSPAAAFRRPYTRVVFDWRQIVALVENPLTALKSAYHWGDPTEPFDHQRLVGVLENVLRVLHVPAERMAPGLQLARLPSADSAYRIQPEVDALRATLGYGFTIHDRIVFEIGFELFPAAKTDDAVPSGFVLHPVLRGGGEGTLPLGERLRLRWRAAGSAGDALGVAVLPDRTDLTGGSATLGAELEVVGTGTTPWYVVGSARTARIELHGVSLRASIEGDAGNPEARLRLSANGANGQPGAKLVVPLDDADGFLRRIVDKGSLELSFSPEVTWSSRTGLTFNGKPTLDLTFPIEASLGGVRLRDLQIRLDAKSPGDRPVLAFAASAAMEVSLGPVRASVDGLGLALTCDFATTPRNFGVVDVSLGFKPPTGIGLSLDSTVAQGAGVLVHDAARHLYAGAAQLTVRDKFALDVAGLLTTRMPDGRDGYSLLLLGVVRFPPIPIGFGFSLNEIGALVGINRTADVDALTGALAAGDLDAMLFPSSSTALAAVPGGLGKLFPPKPDAHVIGVLAGFTWGPRSLARIELGFIYDTSAPKRLVAIGRLSIERPQVTLHVLALGVLDFDRGELDLQARLFDSRILGGDLSGDAAIMVRWGHRPDLVLSIGGFHPAYKPPTDFTSRFAPLRRVSLRAHTDEGVLRLGLQAYLAVTSSTVQMGARVDFGVTVSAFSVDGMVYFDALIQWDPALYIDVMLRGSVAVKAGGTTLFGASVAARLVGPGDWYARGTATIAILWWDLDFGFTIGHQPAPPSLPPVDGASQLAAALADPRSLATQVASHALVSVRRATTPGGPPVFHPLDEIAVRQQIVPLGIAVDRMDAGPLAASRTFELAVKVGGRSASTAAVSDAFARAQYVDMSDAEKLSAPSFEQMRSGVRVILDAPAVFAPTVAAGWTYDQFVLTGQGLRPATTQPFVPDAAAVVQALAASAAASAPLRRTGAARYRVPVDALAN